VEREPGLWVAPERSAVAYPEDGCSGCLALGERSFWFRHRRRCVLTAMRRHPPRGTIFDVGGGDGFVTQALIEAGWDAVLVEPSEAAVTVGRGRGLSPVILATLEDAGFLPNTLPAVGLFDVLEHLEDDFGTLATLRRLLIPGGRLYLTVPAYRFLWSAEDDYACHASRYTLRGLERRLRRAGFEILQGSYIFAPLPIPIFLTRTVPSRLGLRRTRNARTTELEHATGGRFLDAILGIETRFLSWGARIPFGGSCLVVAEKPSA
jgi:SAM-dependent methyltransferase